MRNNKATHIFSAKLTLFGSWLVIGLLVGGCVLLNPTSQGYAEDESSTTDPVLFFCIGMHIEPMGAEVSEIALAAGATPKAEGGDPRKPDYHNRAYFERHVENLRTLAAILEQHGGVMAVQAQSPFTTVAAQVGNTILRDLEDQRHEIAQHFHEDAHLGENAGNLPVAVWSAVMTEEIDFIHASSVEGPIRYWSGGNLYPGVLEAASAAGLDVYSDWKNPRTQSTHPQLIGFHPWRPAGGTDGFDVTALAQHDPNGAAIFLPPGEIDPFAFSHKRQITAQGGDAAWFEVIEEALLASIEAASPDRVNAYHFTMHPGEFVGDPNEPLAIVDQFLTQVVDPLAASGKVRWATFSEVADAFVQWERMHPGVDPRQAKQAVEQRLWPESCFGCVNERTLWATSPVHIAVLVVVNTTYAQNSKTRLRPTSN